MTLRFIVLGAIRILLHAGQKKGGLPFSFIYRSRYAASSWIFLNVSKCEDLYLFISDLPLPAKVFVVPICCKFGSVSQYGPQVYSHPITCRGPNRWSPVSRMCRSLYTASARFSPLCL